MSVFPNPVINNLTITLKSGLDNDVIGKLIAQDGAVIREFNLQKRNKSLDLDIQELNPGIYYLELGGLSKKVIISK